MSTATKPQLKVGNLTFFPVPDVPSFPGEDWYFPAPSTPVGSP